MINSNVLISSAISPKYQVALQKAAEVTACLVAGSVNIGTISPTKYYWTNQLARSTMMALKEQGVVEIIPPGVSYQTTTIYLSMLFLLSKGLLGRTPLNNEYLLALLCSPTAMKKITTAPAFLRLMRAIRKQEKALVKQFMIEMVKEYYHGKGFPAQSDESFQIQNRAVSSVLAVAEKEVDRRKEKITGTLEGAAELIEKLKDDCEWEDLGLAVTQFIGEVKTNWLGISSFSLTAMLYNTYFGASRGMIKAPLFHERILNASYLSNEIGLPNGAPALFVSATPDLAEITIRSAGVAVAVFSGCPGLATLAAETALKLVPTGIRNSGLNQGVLRLSERNRRLFMSQLNRGVSAFDEAILARGWKLDSVKKGVLQGLCGVTYALLMGENSSFTIALNSEYFCTYVSALAANHGLARPELFLPEVGMSNLPYKVLVGTVFTLSDWTGSGNIVTTLLCVAATLPMVADLVASHRKYQRVLRLFIEKLDSRVRPALRALNICRFVLEGMNLSNEVAPGHAGPIVQATKGILGSALVAGVGQVVRTAVQNPYVQQTFRAVKQSGSWIASTTLMTHTVGLASRFLGSSLGALATLSGKPMNRRTVALGALALATGYFSESPLLTTLVVEAGSSAL